MAQGKIVDYDLLAAAGASTVKPVSKETKTNFSNFLDMAGEYAAFQHKKTQEFIAAMPNVDLAKVDDAMTDETSAWISGKRDVVVKASQQMTWYPPWTKKYKEAVSNYNEATQAIVNYSKNLDMVLTERQRLIPMNGNYGGGANPITTSNADELVNGDMFAKMDIEDNGDIMITGFVNQSSGEIENKLFKNYGGPHAYDGSLGIMYMEVDALVKGMKTEEEGIGNEPKYNLDQNNAISSFVFALNNASATSIIDLLTKSNRLGGDGETTLMEEFLTQGIDPNNSDNNPELDIVDGGITNTTHLDDDLVGFGYDINSDEYKAAELALTDPDNYSEDIKEELRQFIVKSFTTGYKGYYAGAKQPKGEDRPTHKGDVYDQYKNDLDMILKGEPLPMYHGIPVYSPTSDRIDDMFGGRYMWNGTKFEGLLGPQPTKMVDDNSSIPTGDLVVGDYYSIVDDFSATDQKTYLVPISTNTHWTKCQLANKVHLGWNPRSKILEDKFTDRYRKLLKKMFPCP